MIRGRVLRAAQWLKRYRKPPRLQSVLMGMMTLIITLCLFATVFFSYQSYKEILVQQVASSRNDVLLQVSAKVESLQQNMVTISNLYYYAIKDFEPGLPETRIPALERFSQDYQSALLAIDPGCYVSVIGKNGLHYASAPVELKHLDQQMWFLRIPTQMKESDLFWTQSHREEDGSYSFSLARRIVGGDGVMYTLLVSVPERTIFGTYENIISNNALYVVRQDGRIVSQNSEKMVDLNYFNMDRLDDLVSSGNYKVVQKSGVDFLLSRYDDANYDLVYIEEIPLDDLLDPLKQVRLLTIVIAAFMAASACVIVAVVVRTVTYPLLQLCQRLMSVSNGGFDTKFDVHSWAEVNLINDVSQEMTNKISSLFEDLKVQEKQKRLAELDFLQAQINPHFMYNTLFSIKCLVSLGENDTAELMLENFTGMLRTVLESKEDIISLQQEIYTLQQYFVVLQCRYGDSIHLKLDIPEQLLQMRILKFVLQPIVENSIFHGLEPNGSRGCVSVRAWLDEGKLKIEVADDGAGMDEKQLQEIRDALAGKGSNKGSVGICNVQKRIRLHFGSAYGLKITSKKGSGTQVLLNLPLLYAEDDRQEGG